MVYFWQRQHRSTLALASSGSASPHMCPQQANLPPSAAAAMSTVTLTAGHTSQHNKSQTGSNILSRQHNNNNDNNNNNNSNSNNYNLPTKSHQISPSYMLDKLSEYSRRKQESDRRKVAERELYNLNLKIDKLLLKMEDTEAHSQSRLRLEDECVVCLAAAATMQTFPCGHKVVCRKCLIKTIQVAVSQRCLPLRCVICRDRILTLHHTTHFHSSAFGATFQHSPELPSTLIPVVPQSSRAGCNPSTATIPTGVMSFIAGSRYPSSNVVPLSPNGIGSSSPMTTNTVDNVAKMTCLQGSADDDILRCAPSDLEAFVNSHNDALNMQRSEKPNEQKSIQKCNQRNMVTNNKRSELSSHSFMHSQPIRIHPTATDHSIAFMDSSSPDSAVLASLGSGNLTHKSVSASRFLAKFLPRKNKRTYNWFRHEN